MIAFSRKLGYSLNIYKNPSIPGNQLTSSQCALILKIILSGRMGWDNSCSIKFCTTPSMDDISPLEYYEALIENEKTFNIFIKLTSGFNIKFTNNKDHKDIHPRRFEPKKKSP